MFRSYFMTFTGKYRGGEGHEIKETEEDPHSVAAHQDADVALHARQRWPRWKPLSRPSRTSTASRRTRPRA